jgi:hypothetical protein
LLRSALVLNDEIDYQIAASDVANAYLNLHPSGERTQLYGMKDFIEEFFPDPPCSYQSVRRLVDLMHTQFLMQQFASCLDTLRCLEGLSISSSTDFLRIEMAKRLAGAMGNNTEGSILSELWDRIERRRASLLSSM